jgi:hypothetical protein
VRGSFVLFEFDGSNATNCHVLAYGDITFWVTRMIEETRLKGIIRAVSESEPKPYILLPETPALLPINSMAELLDRYQVNLCGKELIDPRGYRVHFLDTDFVHLIKIVDNYGKEPRNRRMTIDQIRSGRITLVRQRIDIRRTQEPAWARSIIESPTMIVPNWQVMGKPTRVLLISTVRAVLNQV